MAHEPPPDYRRARQAAALALVGAVVFLLTWDALHNDYTADTVLVTSVLGAAAALLGVDILLDMLRRR